MLASIGIDSSKEGHDVSPIIDTKNGTKDDVEVMKKTIGLTHMGLTRRKVRKLQRYMVEEVSLEH